LKDQILLVIDDDAAMRDYLANVLGSKGRVVLPAANGDEGISLALTRKPDLILLDLRMPVMDGVAVCKVLHQNKKTQNIPILVITSSQSREQIEEVMVGGADDFITKPIDLPDMLIRVRALLEWKDIIDPVERLQHYHQTLRELSKTLPPRPRL
jgi:DNA-binding response OmpR family regulator